MKKILELLKKLIKRKSFWFILIVVIAIAIYLSASGGSKVQYVTEKVQKGSLRQTVSETGTVSAKSEIDMNFKGNGSITQINVSEGDEVKTGEVLARLDAGQVEIQVRQAQANLEIAQANLNKLLASASDQDIKVSEEQVNNAQIAYENAKRDHEALLAKLDSDIKTYEQAVDNARDNLMISLDNSLISINHSLDVIEVIFDDVNLQPIFSVENYQYKDNALNYKEETDIKVKVADASLAQAKQTLSDTDIAQAVSDNLVALNTINLALDNTFSALGASLTNYDFNDLDLANYKTSVKTEQSNTTAAINSVQAGNQSFKNAQISLKTALNNKDLNIANSQSSVDSALGAYNLAKAQLDLKKATPRPVDISYYQAQVNQAQAGLDLALTNLEDYIIRAPTDGLITFVNYDVGEQIGFGVTDIASAAKPVISMLSQGDFEIKVDVPESDIIKLQLGDPAEITLDAYGDDVKFTGKVVAIDIAETVIQDVVYYKVTVTLDKTEQEIKNGMTANIDIITAEKNDVLFVPIRAVKQTLDGQNYVEILKNGQPEQVNVEVGLKGDDGIEITSGLNEGQEVITYTKTQ